MASLFNRKPGRYQRRKKAVPILIALGVVITLALAVLAGTVIVKKLTGAQTPALFAPKNSAAGHETDTAYRTQWQPFILGGGALVGYFDEKTMALCTDADTGVTSVVLREQSGARVDLQAVSGSFERLSEEELQRAAIGILQAYYYVPPATADISCTDAVKTGQEYTVQLSAPATADAPAVAATVRLMDAGGELWYAVCLCPAGSDGGELPLVVSRMEIKG